MHNIHLLNKFESLAAFNGIDLHFTICYVKSVQLFVRI